MESNNKRQSSRTQIEVEVQAVSDTKFTIAGRTLDISATGLFVMCDRRFPVGTTCRVLMYPTGDKSDKPISAQGQVVRTAKSGMGIEFVKLEPADTEELKKLVAARPEASASGEAG